MRRYLFLYVIVFAALAVAIGVAARRDARDAAPPVPSTGILGPEGYRAVWKLLLDLEIPVARHVEPLTELPDGEGNLLLLAAPRSRGITDLEAATLRGWIAEGNTLVWLTGLGDPMTYAGPLSTWGEAVGKALESEGPLAWVFGLDLGESDLREETLAERFLPMTLETKFSEGVHEVYVGECLDLPVEGRAWKPVGGVVPGAALWMKEEGRGRVWLIPTPHLLDNGGILHGDNVLFLRNVIRSELGEGRVFFDEYHHGYSASPIAGILTGPVARTVALQLLLLVVFFLWARIRRFGPAVDLVRSARRPAVEYVEAMAELLRRGGKAGEVAQGLARDFRHRMERLAGVPSGLPHGEAVRMLERSYGGNWEELAGWLEASRLGKVDGPKRLVRLARVLHRAEERLGHP